MNMGKTFLMIAGMLLSMVIPALATVINLDMDTVPTANSFTASGTKVEDITSTPGVLTMNIAAGASDYFSHTIGDVLGSGSTISFGATIKFETFSSQAWDRFMYWNGFDSSTNTKYTVRVLFQSNVTLVQYAAGGSQNMATIDNDGLFHTFRVDIDKSTGLGTFYFDGVAKGSSFQVSESSVSGANNFAFGDGVSSGDGAHKEYWDNVFYSNEIVPEPATCCLLSLGCVFSILKRKNRV